MKFQFVRSALFTLCLIIPLVLPILAGVTPTYAFTATVSGTQVSGEYTEPSTNSNGTPLLDLTKTTTYYKLGGAARVKCDEKPASSKTGGQVRQSLCLVPVLIDQEADVDIMITATDTSGNESAESASVRVRIDRLAPAAPK